MGGPWDGSVQHAVVHEAVGQTADVDAATLTVLVGGQLDLLITLNQNLGALKREDVLLPPRRSPHHGRGSRPE